MKEAFKKAVSIMLAAAMLSLVIPTGVMAAGEGNTEYDKVLYVNKDISENDVYPTLTQALDSLADERDTAKNVRIIVQTDTVEGDCPSAVCSSVTVEGRQIADATAEGGMRYPVVTAVAGTGNTAPAWLTVADADGESVRVTFKNITLDGTGDVYSSAKGRAMFSLGENTRITTEGCKVVAEGTVVDVCGECTFEGYDSEFASISKSVFYTEAGADNKLTLKLYGDCKIATTEKSCIANSAGSALDVYIYGGEYISQSAHVIAGKEKFTGYIYGGNFAVTDTASCVVAVSHDTATTAVADISSRLYVYGGSFENKSVDTSNKYVIRPWKGAAVTVYGGSFIIKDGAVIGAGETRNTGFVYVYGGNFIKTGNSGYSLLQHAYNDASKVNKNYFLMGGNYYSNHTNECHAYLYEDYDSMKAAESTVPTTTKGPLNQAYDYVTTTPLTDKQVSYQTYNTAVGEWENASVTATSAHRISLNAPENTGTSYDASKAAVMGFEGYQLASNVTADSQTADIRVIFNINEAIASDAAYERIGFWISKSDNTVIYYSEYKDIASLDYKPAIYGGTTETLYSSVMADGAAQAADDGCLFALLEITGIGNADFDTEIYVRAYAIRSDGSVVYGDVGAISVMRALESN